MKKLLGIILTLCLVLTLAADAFAASKPEITKQPETATTSKKGAVSFSVSVKGTVSSYTWYFVNPETGDKVSGKKLSSTVKGVKVTNPNSKKISLSHVPESMHGWSVYCHINGNGYKIDSDTVTLYVYGMEIPGSDSGAAAPADKGEAKPKEASAPAISSKTKQEEASAPAISSKTKQEEAPAPADSEKAKPEEAPAAAPAATNAQAASQGTGEQNEGVDQGESGDNDIAVENRIITVSSSSKVLLRLDNKGKVTDESPVSSLEFTNAGSFLVRSEEPIKSWTVNGIRFVPAQPVNEFKVTNVTDSISLDVKIARAGTSEVEVDESIICKVTCKGCTFTYLSKGLRSVAEGEVPYGAVIRVIADSSDLANGGYSINGGELESIGKASLQLTVTDDVTIVAGK